MQNATGAPPDVMALRLVDREWFRQLVALPPGLLGLLVPGGALVKVLAFWDVVAVVYLVLSYRTYRTPDLATLRALARPGRPGPLERLISSPPRQFPSSAAVLALLATVLVLPGIRQPEPVAALTTLGISVVAVLSAWVMVQFGFAVAYLGQFVERGGLVFPGADPPVMVDFLYLAVAVGTSFAASDVVVTGRAMRRRVMAHSLLAFGFNAVIIASVVAIVSTFVVR